MREAEAARRTAENEFVHLLEEFKKNPWRKNIVNERRDEGAPGARGCTVGPHHATSSLRRKVERAAQQRRPGGIPRLL